MPPNCHKGWHSRGYLPHLDAANLTQAITFRLADALPAKVIESWRIELVTTPATRDRQLREKIARYEDAGHGSCVLARPELATIVRDALLHFDSDVTSSTNGASCPITSTV